MARCSALALAIAIATGCVGANPADSQGQSTASATSRGTSATRGDASPSVAVPAGPLPAQSIDASRRTAITTAVERVAPTVVSVQTETLERVPADYFEMMFGGRSGQRSRAGIGSGFIVRADGVIVTNAHVVSGASTITVALRDGTTYPATLVGEDEQNDLAVLRIDGRDLPVAEIGTSSDLLVGEWSIAIGNPFGFVLGNTEPSVSVGVISAVGRNITARSEGAGVYLDMVQTDAAINPGNSGGPLVNAMGRVIGVNSSIYSPSGGSVGLGFAIPIDRTMRIVNDLLEHGRVRQPWVGLHLQLPELASARDAVKAVPVVGRIVPGSPAERAGVKAGDVVVRAAAREIRNPFDWEARLLELRVGDTLPLVVRRGGREIALQLTIADVPEVSAPRVTVLRELELVTLTDAIRQERGIRSRAGALIVKASERLQGEIGLQSGDVILQIGNTPITSADLAARAIEAYGARGAVRLWFERGGQGPYSIAFRVR
ncbi:MAG: trypsin-like peptidase domain-containing protein [Gemmatimonadaceae bacterium]|jgi:serine protease Do|nr:trypsin-like peptidase domain-containing protein [Gemmatimonadaceae bacterium]